MHDPPPDLEPGRLADELVAGWNLMPVSLRHLRLGFGGYHWRATDAAGWVAFVSVTDLGRAFGATRTARERNLLASALGRLHAATSRLPVGLAPREDFALQGRDALERALADLARPWTAGPYAEGVRRLLESHAPHLDRELQAYDAAVAGLQRPASAWVVTHGEPHPGNVIKGPHARLRLVDWDTVALAPAERDLHLLLGRRLGGWRAYRRAAAATATMDRAAFDLYRTRGHLTDVATAVATLRPLEERSTDAEVSWRALRAAWAD